MSKNRKKKRDINALLYTISHPNSEIRDNRENRIISLNRNEHLIIGEWNATYCSAKEYRIGKIIFPDKHHFSVYLTSIIPPQKPYYEGTYILRLHEIQFSIQSWPDPERPCPFIAKYEVSNKMLTVESEIVTVMYVKN